MNYRDLQACMCCGADLGSRAEFFRGVCWLCADVVEALIKQTKVRP